MAFPPLAQGQQLLLEGLQGPVSLLRQTQHLPGTVHVCRQPVGHPMGQADAIATESQTCGKQPKPIHGEYFPV